MKLKRLVRWAGVLLAMVLLTPVAVLIVLYMPPIQHIATQWALAQLTRQTGMEIGAERVQLLFPLRIEVEGMHIGTLLSIEHLRTNIRPRPLLQGSIKADYVAARNINVHTDTLTRTAQTEFSIQQLRIDDISYHLHQREAHIQRVLLAENNITLHQRTAPKTKRKTPLQLPLSVAVSDILILRTEASYTNNQKLYQGTANELALHNVVVDTTKNIILQSAEIKDGTFAFQGAQLTQLNVRADSLRYTPTDFAMQLTRLTFKESHGINLQEGILSLAWHEGVLSLPDFALRTEHSSLQGHLRTLGYGVKTATIDGDADICIGHTDARLLAQWLGGTSKEFAPLYPTETLSASIALDGTMAQLRLQQCHITLPTAFDININGTIQDISTPQQCRALCHIEAKTYNLDFLTTLIGDTAIRIPTRMTYQGDISYAPDTLHAQCSINLGEGIAMMVAGFRPTNRVYEVHVLTDSLDIRQILPYGELGPVTLQAHLVGNGLDYKQEDTSVHGTIQLHQLQWREHIFSNASAQIVKDASRWYAHASCHDSLMQWSLTTTIWHTPDTFRARIHTQIDNLNLQALQITDTDICPSLQCHATLAIDSDTCYSLRSRLSDITLHTATQSIRPQPLDLQAKLTTDTVLLDIRSGDLTLTANAHAKGLPWQWKGAINRSKVLTHLQATLTVGSDNPVSNYLSLLGIKYQNIHVNITDRMGAITSSLAINGFNANGIKTDNISLNAHYTDGILQARLQSEALSWFTPQIQLKGRVDGTIVWGEAFALDSLSGQLRLSDMQFTLPAYSLQLYTKDTLSIPLERGGFTLHSQPLYSIGGQPLRLDGRIKLFDNSPTVQLHLTARDTELLQVTPTQESLLYGKAFINGDVMLDGTFNALFLSGELQVRPNSSIHYIYKDAILTASNQLDNVITFVSFDADTTSLPRIRRATSNITMSLNIAIDPTVQLGVSLGASKQNSIAIQGGGMLNLQYSSTIGLHLSGRYSIEQGMLNMNVPLLHVNSMAIRTGSTVTWEGNPLNPILNISAEDRIRASVTLDGSPQSVLFVAGVSFTDTMEKLNVQFTLAAPENASMQNTLATLSPDERGKLSVALLTTGLYLGEGGTGNLMNTTLMSILQAQLDNISRDAFRTVDVSVGIEPLLDGVSGVSTRTDYSFSVAKRLWNNRIRFIIGGSVTTSNERIEDDAVIDNISIEWRISPIGNQYLRFFYDKNFESILEGEIREMGVGYAYRRRF